MPKRKSRATTVVRKVAVDPAVMAAARRARRWGERLVVVNKTTVRLVPDR